MSLDLTESIAPKSDQLNAEDLLTGPRTFTIEKVTNGSTEQPFNFHLVEMPGRPYRPSKTMRKLMVKAWGHDASTYDGHMLRLYRDPEVTFGRDKVGGIKISHFSHIAQRVEEWLTETRGRRALYAADPLPALDDIASCSDRDRLKSWWIHEPLRPQIRARVAELDAPAQESAQ